MYSFSKRLAAMKKLGLADVGVKQTASLESSEIKIKNNSGLLAIYSSGQQVSFELILSVKRDSGACVVWTEGAARAIRTLRDLTPGEYAATFTRRIPTSLTLSDEYATKKNDYDSNGVWFIITAGGKLRMWEVAIVTDIRDGHSRYYLSLQEVYRADLFNKNGAVWVPPEQFPRYENWKSLHSFLAAIAAGDELKPVSKYKKPRSKALPPLAGNQARIDWFSQSRRYGFATLADGLTGRLHAGEVLEQEFPAFEPGEVVTFEKPKLTPKGCDLLGVRAALP